MKKLLAVLIAVVMLFSFAAVPVSATLEDAPVGDTTVAPENFLTDIIARIKAFVASFREMIHELIGGILDLVDKECPFCDQIHRTIIKVDAESFADAFAKAEEGDTFVLAAGEYGAVTLGTLEDVVIDAQGEATIGFITTAETDIKDVTVKGLNLSIPDNNAMNGVLINGEAAIENLVIADSTFTGAGEKKGRAIYGTNPNATITITNCTFENMGYPIYTMASNGGFAGLTVDGCTFKAIKSWCVMPQYGTFSGDLTVTNNSFTDCTGGLVKSGAIAAGNTFTFANNTIVNSTEHPAKDWFSVNASAGTAVIEGNTRDGVEWIPGAGEGIK